MASKVLDVLWWVTLGIVIGVSFSLGLALSTVYPPDSAIEQLLQVKAKLDRELELRSHSSKVKALCDLYYSSLAEGDTQTAWSLTDSNYRRQFGGYAAFKSYWQGRTVMFAPFYVRVYPDKSGSLSGTAKTFRAVYITDLKLLGKREVLSTEGATFTLKYNPIKKHWVIYNISNL